MLIVYFNKYTIYICKYAIRTNDETFGCGCSNNTSVSQGDV